MDPIQTVSTNQIDKPTYNLRILLWGVLCTIPMLLLIKSGSAFFILAVFVAVFVPLIFSKLFEGDLRSSTEINFYPDGVSVNDEKFNYKDLSKIKAFKRNKGQFIYARFWGKEGADNRWVFYDVWIKNGDLRDIFTKQVRAYNDAAPADEKVNYV
jgi:hypothetical protein